jgi:hypothetical protein
MSLFNKAQTAQHLLGHYQQTHKKAPAVLNNTTGALFLKRDLKQ